MLASKFSNSTCSGTLTKDVHKPAEFISELLDFIHAQLPVWRDRPEREHKTSETHLTSQLCAHLNSATRLSTGWDILQFRTEEPDEKEKRRKIDLAPAPSGVTISINGRSYSDFDSLLPIECKRLPTPKRKDRDEREYVSSLCSTTGGIQRFKAGHHGAAHSQGAIIAYIQEDTVQNWQTCIAGWINGLVAEDDNGWSSNDLLHIEQEDTINGVAVLNSSHARENGLPEIKMRHLWVKMN